MRVTHVITRLIAGGAQENTIASVLGLNEKAGLEVRLVSGTESGPEGSLAPAFEHAPESLVFVPELVRAIHPWKDAMAYGRLVEIFRSQEPQIVHTHSGKAGVLGRLAARRAGVPVIVHTIHGPSFGSFQGPMANWFFRAAERRAGRVTTHFAAVADAMIQQYLAAGIGRADQYTKILSGFKLEPFLAAANDLKLRAELGITAGDFVVGTAARFFKLKGYEDLFRAAPDLVRDCPQMKFLLLGDGPGRKKFESQARGLNLEKHFVFAGLVPPPEVPRLMGIMDVLVHLSRREGLARALPQALAAAKPVLAYDCDGAGEVCLDERTGFLLRPGDLAALRTSINRLAGDASLRERLGRNGREFVRERFGVETMVDALHTLYLSLAAGAGIPIA